MVTTLYFRLTLRQHAQHFTLLYLFALKLFTDSELGMYMIDIEYYDKLGTFDSILPCSIYFTITMTGQEIVRSPRLDNEETRNQIMS